MRTSHWETRGGTARDLKRSFRVSFRKQLRCKIDPHVRVGHKLKCFLGKGHGGGIVELVTLADADVDVGCRVHRLQLAQKLVVFALLLKIKK